MSLILINDLGRHTQACLPDIQRSLNEVAASGWYVLGPRVKQFESLFAAYCDSSHCIGVANGSDALELAVRALDLAPGSRVATVANAAMYATNAILAAGAAPWFVDVDAQTLCMAPERLAAALEDQQSNIKAVILTHLYGQLADVTPIAELCRQHGIALIEDCAQAHGARRDGRGAGSFGDIACFSFYPTKNLGALGDGGALVTRDPDYAERLHLLRQYGWSHKYHVGIHGGRNSRLDEIQAAVLTTKLTFLDNWNNARRDIASRYVNAIRHSSIQLPLVPDASSVAHLFVVRTPLRDSLRAHLKAYEICSDIHYPIPDHRQACFGTRYAQLRLPVTDEAATKILTLPCFPEMTNNEIERVIDACNSWKP